MSDAPLPPAAKIKAAQVRALVTGAIVGMVIMGGFVVVIGVLLVRQSIPPLTEVALTAAHDRWQAQRPSNYDYEVQVSGNRPGMVRVQVRQGKVTGLVRDGNPNTAQRTWSYWSIDGLFKTLERELEMAGTTPAAGDAADAVASTQGAALNAKFDAQWGYPELFRRHVSGRQLDLGWQITRFEVVDQ